MTEVTSRPLVDVHAVERRTADGRDSAFVRDLFAESRADLYLLTSDTRDVIVDMQFRAQRRAWRCDFPLARQEVLVLRGVRAGHLLIAEDDTTVQIVDLVVRPSLRGLGIGAALLDEVVADADRSDRAVRARVWPTNHGARRFFLRAGLSAEGAVAGYHEMVRPRVQLGR